MATLDETKKLLRSLITSTPLKLTLYQLNRDYKEMEGCEIPFRHLGFESLEHLMYSIPDTVELLGSGMFAEVRPVIEKSALSNEINRLVTNQKVSCGKKPKRSKGRHQETHRVQHPRVRSQSGYNMFSNTNIQSTNICDMTKFTHHGSTNINIQYQNVNTNILRNNEKYDDNKQLSTNLNFSFEPINRDDEISYSESETETDEEEIIYNKVPSRIQENLKKLLKNQEEGIWCAKLPHLYKSNFGSELNYMMFGYKSLAHMCTDLSPAFQCVQPGRGDFQLFYKESSEKCNVPTKCNKFSDLSFKHSKDSDKLPCIPIDNSRKSTIPIANLQKWESSDALPYVDDLVYIQLQNETPSDTVKLFEELERQWIDVNVLDYVDIRVTEIYDPSKFWVVLANENCYVKLTQIKEDLQDFYRDFSLQLKITNPQLIRVGLYCVSKLYSQYCRAIVVNTDDKEKSEKIKIFYIDYGTIRNVPIKEIFFLHRRFFEFPAQAIRGRLAILPPKSSVSWPEESCKKFFDLVVNKQLVAQIVGKDFEKKIVDLYICDTTTEEDIMINDCLVREGFADILHCNSNTRNQNSQSVTPKKITKKDLRNYIVNYKQQS